jgi:hypothetical protein
MYIYALFFKRGNFNSVSQISMINWNFYHNQDFDYIDKEQSVFIGVNRANLSPVTTSIYNNKKMAKNKTIVLLGSA